MESYKKLAKALGESLESVCNMREEERDQLFQVFEISAEPEPDPVDEFGIVIDKAFAGDSPKKTTAQGRKRGRHDYFTFDDDDDFVKKPSPKAPKVSPDKDLMRMYAQSSGSTSQGRVTRRAANRANLNIGQITKALEDEDNYQAYNPYNFNDDDELPELIPQLPLKSSEKEVEEVTMVNKPTESTPNNVEADENENIAEMFEKINKLCKQKVMVNHTRNPQALFNSSIELPSMDLDKASLITRSKSPAKSQSKRCSLGNHLKTMRKISTNALVHGSLSSLPWQRLCNSRSRLINVNTVNVDKEVDEVNISSIFDLGLEDIHIEEPPKPVSQGLPSQEFDFGTIKDSPKPRKRTSLVGLSPQSILVPVPGPSSEPKKVDIKPTPKYRIPRLKSKEKSQEAPGLKIEHFFDKTGGGNVAAEDPPVVDLVDDDSGPKSPIYRSKSSPRKRLTKKIRSNLKLALCPHCEKQVLVSDLGKHVESCNKKESDK